MDTGDALYRASGGVMVLSGLFNALAAFFWFISLVWVCVGVFWLIPLAIALTEVGVGILMLVTGRKFKLTAFMPLLGLVASVCNFNFMGGMLDLVAIGLGIGGFVAAGQAAELDDRS